MGKRLADAEIARYHRDGFLSPIDAFSPAEARAFRDRLEDFERRDGKRFGKGHNFKPHLLFPWVDALVRHPAVLDPVEDIIGPDIRLFHFTIWPKSPGDPAYVSWHQDATYFGLDPAVHITAWVALTEVPVESGAVEVVPGSHTSGQLHHGQFDASDNLLSRGQTLTVDFNREDSVFMTLKPGQMSLHHTHLIHRSGPNLSTDRRIGFGISYIPTSATCRARVKQSAMLVRAGSTATGISTTNRGHAPITARPSRRLMPRRSHDSAPRTPRKWLSTRQHNDLAAGDGADVLRDGGRLRHREVSTGAERCVRSDPWRCGRWQRRSGDVMRLISAFLLVACLVLAGCADSDKRSDDSPFGGFYGGVSGGAGSGSAP